MIIPVRCYSCGKVVANKWLEYERRVGEGESKAAILTELGYTRVCCRRMFLGNVNTIDKEMAYK